MVSFKLVRRYLTKHLIRSGLTIGSLLVAIFLVCVLRSLVWSLDAGIRAAKRDRLVVQSAVSLFVNLPMSYQEQMAQVPGVTNTCKFHWFGGYYQDPKNFFAQFAVDAPAFLAMYPEAKLVDGSRETFLADRQGALVGKMLAQEFGWKVGDVFPLTGIIYPAEAGQTWEFRVAAIYEPASSALDSRTVFFHWDYFQRTLEGQSRAAPIEVATYALQTAGAADQVAIQRAVDELFAGGPQRVNCNTEAEFNAQFVTMLGSVPLFLSAIGGGVLIAVLFACVNTMLMSFREQMHDVGILKALGFTDGAVARMMLAQSLLVCMLGGGLGLLLAKGSEPAFVMMIGAMFPGYAVTPGILGLGAGLTVAVGLVAAIVPTLRARRLAVVTALRSDE